MSAAANTLVIACGALAKEIVALRKANGWSHMDVSCLPAELHNRPEKIPGAVREKIQHFRCRYANLFVAYADCGTGGMLDTVLEEEGVERIAGAHCYEFYAGAPVFEALAEQEIGTFYLTDFLLRHFERLVIHGLGIDKHPALLPVYFGNYKKLVYLAQVESDDGRALGQCAARLEAQYSDDDLQRIIRAHGVDASLPTPTVLSADEVSVPEAEGGT